jgi:hypothetical protein
MVADILTKTVEQSINDAEKQASFFVNHWSVIDLFQETVCIRIEIKRIKKLINSYVCSIEISTDTVMVIESVLGNTLIEAFENAISAAANVAKDVDFRVYKLPCSSTEENWTCYELYNLVSTALERITNEVLGIENCLVVKARNF